MLEMSPEHRKAAILLSSLDPQTADSLLRQMDPVQAGALRAALRVLGEVDPREQQRVATEFLAARSLIDSPANGGDCQQHLAERQSGRETLDTTSDTPASAFQFLRAPDSEDLASLLAGEQPQTIALVVSHLSAERGAQLVAALPDSVQADVLRRLAELDDAHPDVIREIECGLESRIVARSQLAERRAAGLNAVSNILAAADVPVGQQIRRNLVRHDAELAQSLSRGPFLFSDLALLDDASLWTLLSAADPDWVVLAFAGAQLELAQRVAGLLPPDEAGDFRQAIEQLGPTRLSDVEEAQHRIAELAHRLELEGNLRRSSWRLGTVEV